MRAIILAAGQGYKLDGFNKLLIVDPKDNKTLLDKYVDAFGEENLTVVLGFRAINVMHQYPNLNYIFNSDWNVTNNSYSLAIALQNEPCCILSGDLIVDPDLLEVLKEDNHNLVITRTREHRTSTALNTVTNTNGIVTEFYQGKLRSQNDRESMGVFKIIDAGILRKWRQNCFDNPHSFAAQNLPVGDEGSLFEMISDKYELFEIDTPLDFLNLIKSRATTR